MEKKKVELRNNGHTYEFLLLSDEQIRLLNHLLRNSWLIDDTEYEIIKDEIEYKEI